MDEAAANTPLKREQRRKTLSLKALECKQMEINLKSILVEDDSLSDVYAGILVETPPSIIIIIKDMVA